MFAVEAGAPLHEFSIVRGNREKSLLSLYLMDSNAPKGEKSNVGIDALLVKTIVPTVVTDILLLGRPACKDEVERGGRVHFEDCIAEERGGKECPEAFEVDGATADCGGSGEGSKIVDCEAVGNLHSAGEDHLDGKNGRLMVNNNGDGCGAHSNKESHFICGAEEVSA